MPSIDIVWSRIKAHEDETFHQIRGRAFHYSVIGSRLIPNTTNRNLPKSDFEKALNFLPLINIVPLQNLQGPSYLYAILMDKRIRGTDW